MAIENNNALTKRRIFIAVNVAAAVAFVWGLIVLANVFAEKTSPPPWDCTRAGLFSLSSRTTKLLEKLDDNVRLTALYRIAEDDKTAREQKQRVADLLRRYGSVSAKVTYDVIDPLKDTAPKTKLIDRLKTTYSGEATQHTQHVARFQKLLPDVQKLLQQEITAIATLVEKTPAIKNDQNILAAYYRLTRTREQARIARDDVHELIEAGDIPRYSDAAKLIESLYSAVQADLREIGKYLTAEGVKLEGLDDTSRQTFADAEKRYQSVLDPITDELKTLADLPKLELETIYDQVKSKKSKTIVVEANDKAKVLTFNDVWVRSSEPSGDPNLPPKYDFNGEAALSSAVLALTAKEKSAVIFVHAGPPNPVKPGFAMMRMTPPPFGQAKEKLEEANFVVDAWDVRAAPTPPDLDDVTRKVYVVMPPQPQQRRGPTPQPQGGYEPQHVAAIKDLLDRGERMIFLVNFSPPMMGTPYPFAELLKNQFGITCETSKIVLRIHKLKEQLYPVSQIGVVRYPAHEITDPIQSYASAFPTAIPLLIDKNAPENVTVNPLVTIDDTMGTHWGESNIFMLVQQRWVEKNPDDTMPPFHLALAAQNSKTDAKVVVFGDSLFPSNDIATKVKYVMTPKGIAGYLEFPGNLELFANSAFWLNDNQNLIAVGPRRGDVARIANISPGGILAWKVFLWVVWPLAALIAGGAVYMVRRK